MPRAWVPVSRRPTKELHALPADRPARTAARCRGHEPRARRGAADRSRSGGGRPARGPGGTVRHSGRAGRAAHPRLGTVPRGRPAAASAAGPSRGPRSAPIRPGRRVGVRPRGARRVPDRRHHPRLRRHRLRPGGRSPQRHDRPVPRLRGLSPRSARADRTQLTEDSRYTNKEHLMSRENSLVSAQWVEDNLDNDKIVLIEVDEDTTAYDKGHIKGAIKLDWTTDLQDQVRRDFVDKEQFEALLSSRGVANDDTIVLYGGNNNWFAAYAYWYFKLYGHEDVKLLDGGRQKWELDGRPLSRDAVTRPATQYKAAAPDLSIRAFRDEVIAAIGTKNLVDVRSPDEFSGKILAPAPLPQEQSQRPGHIPTAINVPWSKAANEDGTFKSDDDLRELYAEAGLDGSQPTIAYCRIGERSSHTWVVLRELLGHSDVKNYDGSWTEYGSLIGVPIELGAGQK